MDGQDGTGHRAANVWAWARAFGWSAAASMVGAAAIAAAARMSYAVALGIVSATIGAGIVLVAAVPVVAVLGGLLDGTLTGWTGAPVPGRLTALGRALGVGLPLLLMGLALTVATG